MRSQIMPTMNRSALIIILPISNQSSPKYIAKIGWQNGCFTECKPLCACTTAMVHLSNLLILRRWEGETALEIRIFRCVELDTSDLNCHHLLLNGPSILCFSKSWFNFCKRNSLFPLMRSRSGCGTRHRLPICCQWCCGSMGWLPWNSSIACLSGWKLHKLNLHPTGYQAKDGIIRRIGMSAWTSPLHKTENRCSSF